MSFEQLVEPERYEFQERPLYRFGLDRREFLKVVGGGIVVVCLLREVPAQQRQRGRRGRGPSQPAELDAWLHIGQDGQITVYTGKAEVGQDIRTELTQVVAEELRSDMAMVQLVMGDTELVPYDMGTFGSRTTPTMAPQLRRAAGAARELLIDLAADKWQVGRTSISVTNGRLLHPDKTQTLLFGDLTQGQKLLKTISSDVITTPPDEWQVCGRAAPKVAGPAIVTGRHRYASDIRRPGMLFGKVLRPRVYGATLSSVDLTKAQAMSGVTVVRDGEFVGVAARDELTASQALDAITAEWRTEPQPSYNEIYNYLKEHPREGGGWRGRSRNQTSGSIEDGLQGANQRLQESYTIAYIAHAPLEPRAAVAEWMDGKLLVWTGTQRPFGVRDELADTFNLPQVQVRVRVPDTGSGYGGKHTGEVAIEAAKLARTSGKPVKVVWTREEEFTWAYFRPAGVIDIESGVKRDGTITAWRFKNFNSGTAAMTPLYRIPNQEIVFQPTESPLRQGSYRALAATANHFARETHIDEMARVVDMDPLALRLLNLEDPRQKAVLQAAADHFGWHNKQNAPRRGCGIACGFEKGSYIATCAEVSMQHEKSRVQVERLVAAFECGAIINPQNLENQVQGALIMGLGGALYEAIEFENGSILNPWFSKYRVPRFRDVPKIEIVLLDRKDLPSVGAGETPIVAVAPAIGNAIFDAIGIRLRSLPLLRGGLG